MLTIQGQTQDAIATWNWILQYILQLSNIAEDYILSLQHDRAFNSHNVTDHYLFLSRLWRFSSST